MFKGVNIILACFRDVMSTTYMVLYRNKKNIMWISCGYPFLSGVVHSNQNWSVHWCRHNSWTIAQQAILYAHTKKSKIQCICQYFSFPQSHYFQWVEYNLSDIFLFWFLVVVTNTVKFQPFINTKAHIGQIQQMINWWYFFYFFFCPEHRVW